MERNRQNRTKQGTRSLRAQRGPLPINSVEVLQRKSAHWESVQEKIVTLN